MVKGVLGYSFTLYVGLIFLRSYLDTFSLHEVVQRMKRFLDRSEGLSTLRILKRDIPDVVSFASVLVLDATEELSCTFSAIRHVSLV